MCVCGWPIKKLCRNAHFGDLTKNHMYNYTSAILTSVISKICLSHFQSSMNQHGICEMKPPKKQTDCGLGFWRTSFLCLALFCFHAWRAIYPHMVATNKEAVKYCVVVFLVKRFCHFKVNHRMHLSRRSFVETLTSVQIISTSPTHRLQH